MENIYDKARELGKLIQDSPEMAAVKEAEKKQEEDEKAQEMIKEYNLLRMNLARKAQSENATPETLKEIREELNKEFAKLTENQSILAFINAKKAFDVMVGNINDILAFYITGEEPKKSSCSSDCSSCGGCH